MQQLRVKFINQAKKYFGCPYARKYWPKDSEEYNSKLFLDCCGLVRQVLRDLASDFGFIIGPWNQAYMFDTLPITVESEEQMKPGDLVFMSGTYVNPNARNQKHFMTHVEIWLGDGPKTIGARWNNGKVQIFDHYKFEAKSFTNTVYYFKSIDTWLKGICKSYCPEHKWKRSKFKPGKKSVFRDKKQKKDIQDTAEEVSEQVVEQVDEPADEPADEPGDEPDDYPDDGQDDEDEDDIDDLDDDDDDDNIDDDDDEDDDLDDDLVDIFDQEELAPISSISMPNTEVEECDYSHNSNDQISKNSHGNVHDKRRTVRLQQSETSLLHRFDDEMKDFSSGHKNETKMNEFSLGQKSESKMKAGCDRYDIRKDKMVVIDTNNIDDVCQDLSLQLKDTSIQPTSSTCISTGGE